MSSTVPEVGAVVDAGAEGSTDLYVVDEVGAGESPEWLELVPVDGDGSGLRVPARDVARAVVADGGPKPDALGPEGMDEEHKRRAVELGARTVLKRRESEVYALKEDGLSHSEIADRLGLEKSTVDSYSRRINDRLERARRTLELVDDEPDRDDGDE